MDKGWKGQGQSGFKGQGSGAEGKGDGAWGKVIPNPKLKLMDQVREVMRLRHYSIRTERCYVDWIRRSVWLRVERSRTSPREFTDLCSTSRSLKRGERLLHLLTWFIKSLAIFRIRSGSVSPTKCGVLPSACPPTSPKVARDLPMRITPDSWKLLRAACLKSCPKRPLVATRASLIQRNTSNSTKPRRNKAGG